MTARTLILYFSKLKIKCFKISLIVSAIKSKFNLIRIKARAIQLMKKILKFSRFTHRTSSFNKISLNPDDI
jgi:hypothetical protein